MYFVVAFCQTKKTKTTFTEVKSFIISFGVLTGLLANFLAATRFFQHCLSLPLAVPSEKNTRRTLYPSLSIFLFPPYSLHFTTNLVEGLHHYTLPLSHSLLPASSSTAPTIRTLFTTVNISSSNVRLFVAIPNLARDGCRRNNRHTALRIPIPPVPYSHPKRRSVRIMFVVIGRRTLPPFMLER